MDSAGTLKSMFETLLGTSSTYMQTQSYLHGKQSPQGHRLCVAGNYVAGTTDVLEVTADGHVMQG